MKTLGVLDINGLNVAVQLLLGTLLIVTSSRNADAQSVADTLDTVLPNLLVQSGVQTDIRGTLLKEILLALSFPNSNILLLPFPSAGCKKALSVVSYRFDWITLPVKRE